MVTNYLKVSTTLEHKIADQVLEADKNVHEVFVSVNSDFYNQIQTTQIILKMVKIEMESMTNY
jgi:S-adenosylmethionine synthetase